MEIEIELSRETADRLWKAKATAGRDDLTAAEYAEMLLLWALRHTEREQQREKENE